MKLCFERFARYNTWMNEKLYVVANTIPDELRKEDRGAFFKSIHGTLNHLLLADRVWLGRFTESPFVVKSLDQELFSNFAELWSARRETDFAIEEWVRELTEERLIAPFCFTRITASGEWVFPLWQVVIHLFNHQTHHRGQLTTLLNQMGYDSGVTDILQMPERNAL